MAVIVAISLGVLALIFVLYPLFHRMPTFPEAAIVQASMEEPVECEQAARATLQEVELDFQLGNIAEQDYRHLREQYMRRALVALKSRYDREQELDEIIEEQLCALREDRGKEGKDESA